MRLPENQRGQGIVEYALIFILVIIIVFVIISLLGPAIMEWINEFLNSVRGEETFLTFKLIA